MKRLFLMIVLVMLVYMVARSHRREDDPAQIVQRPPAHWAGVRHRHAGNAGNRFANEAREALDEAHRAINEARDEIRQAYNEAREEVHQVFDGDDDSWSRPNPPREEAEGLPVPIVPGTRVTVAQTRPPAPPIPPVRPVSSARPAVPAARAVPAPMVAASVALSQTRIVKGQISATEERAKADVRHALGGEVVDWLDPEVPGSWAPPSRLVDAMVLETRINPVVKDYGTLYVAELKVDFSPERRKALVQVFHREQVRQRLTALGGILGFVLICLAAISGYIRSDEATKGYYTNRLRMLTAAGVGAAGVIIYQMLA
jgi:hypothetical protein